MDKNATPFERAARVAGVSAETRGTTPEKAAGEAAGEDGHEGRHLDSKTILPALAILALIVVPILIWATTSGGSDNQLRIDQGVSTYGEPEIVVNVPVKLNNPAEANDAASVKLVCVDSGGKTVLATDQAWPFINEPGYPYPHIHQPVTPKQLQAIAKCRVEGTKTKLEGESSESLGEGVGRTDASRRSSSLPRDGGSQ